VLIAVEYDNRVTVVDNAADTIEVFWRFGDEYLHTMAFKELHDVGDGGLA